MEIRYFPILEIRFLSKEGCDNLHRYIEKNKGIFNYKGDKTPVGEYNVKIFYNEKFKVSKKELEKHYNNLLKILMGQD